jgi:hypothetical protein
MTERRATGDAATFAAEVESHFRGVDARGRVRSWRL